MQRRALQVEACTPWPPCRPTGIVDVMSAPQIIRSADEHEWPVLVLATVGGVTLAVGGLWLAVVTAAAWALVLAVILILFGVVAVVTVIAALLDQETSVGAS